ncbi:hypothetical protein O181_006147 [Austropuccinia psidii MF-1]|uniref:Secreted protein n=1 Tax=Austropuccinia psidii MF-1 TaxID=1389203 RepID=A0A9Q3BJH8_9BASI|nr:hypothetical protein [Austropuccinia psidii MF-1]
MIAAPFALFLVFSVAVKAVPTPYDQNDLVSSFGGNVDAGKSLDYHSGYGSSDGSHTVTKSYESLDTQISESQKSIDSGINESDAIQKLSGLAQSVQSTFKDFLQSHSGGSVQLGDFSSVFQSFFSEFRSLVATVQTKFPDRWNSIVQDCFGSLSDTFKQFFEVCKSGGLSFNSFLSGDASSWVSTFQQLGFNDAPSYLSTVQVD